MPVKVSFKFTKLSTKYKAWLYTSEGRFFGITHKDKVIEFHDTWSKKEPSWINKSDIVFHVEDFDKETILKEFPEVFL